MPDEYMDPSGNTAQFRAFATESEPAAPPTRRTGLIVAAAVAGLVAVALLIWTLSALG